MYTTDIFFRNLDINYFNYFTLYCFTNSLFLPNSFCIYKITTYLGNRVQPTFNQFQTIYTSSLYAWTSLINQAVLKQDFASPGSSFLELLKQVPKFCALFSNSFLIFNKLIPRIRFACEQKTTANFFCNRPKKKVYYYSQIARSNSVSVYYTHSKIIYFWHNSASRGRYLSYFILAWALFYRLDK